MTRQAIRKHLDLLEAAGLVQGKRRGREHVWLLLPKRIDEAHAHLDAVSRQWEDALERLRRHVEAGRPQAAGSMARAWSYWPRQKVAIAAPSSASVCPA